MSGQGETILVVEDDVITRAAIAEILEDLGYRVLAAANGKEALEKFESHVALVLSDLVMPHMGGGDLYASLREKHPNLKMIVITGYPMNDEGRALLERGITGWIKKPFVPEELAEIVRAALE